MYNPANAQGMQGFVYLGQLVALSTLQGSACGGSLLRLSGLGFHVDRQVMYVCTFQLTRNGAYENSTAVMALDSSRINCEVPRSSFKADTATFKLFQDDVAMLPPTAADPVFTFQECALSISPAAGPTQRENTFTINGAGFDTTVLYSVRFQLGVNVLATRPAQPTSADQIVLNTPAWSFSGGAANVMILKNQVALPSSSSLRLNYTFGEFWISKLTHNDSAVGGATVTVIGAGFSTERGAYYRCGFSTRATTVYSERAAAISTSVLVCIAPAWEYRASSSLTFSVEKQFLPDSATFSIVSSYDDSGASWAYLECWVSMGPLQGSSTGGALITIAGAGFTPAGRGVSYQCTFTSGNFSLKSLRVEATDTQTIVLASPVWTAGNAVVFVQLFAVGTGFSDLVQKVGGFPPALQPGPNSYANFTYRPVWRMLEPTSGFSAGSSPKLRISGAGFSTSPSVKYACRFVYGRTSMNVTGTAVSDMLIECPSPKWGALYPTASTEFSLLQDDVEIPRENRVQQYYVMYEEWSELENFGGLYTGGTEVNVKGAGFDPQAGAVYTCRFKAETAVPSVGPPSLITRVLITSPAPSLLTPVPFLSSRKVQATSPTTITCIAPPWPYPELLTTVDVLRDLGSLVHYSGSQPARFQYVTSASERWIQASPQVSSTLGGLSVTILGASFQKQISYSCQWTVEISGLPGSPKPIVQSAPVLPVSDTEIRCVVPRWVYAAGDAVLDVLQGGREIRFEGMTQEFRFTPVILGILRRDGSCFAPPRCNVLEGSITAKEMFLLVGEGFNPERLNSSYCGFRVSSGTVMESTVKTPVVQVLSPQQVVCQAPKWNNPILKTEVTYSYDAGADVTGTPALSYLFVPDLDNIAELTVLQDPSTFAPTKYQESLAKAMSTPTLPVSSQLISILSNGSTANLPARRAVDARFGRLVTVFNVSILDSATQSGSANMQILKALADLNDVALRALQITMIRFYGLGGEPKVVNFQGTCPGPLTAPCRGHGSCVGDGVQQLKTCECAAAFGLGDCKPLPLVLDVCVGSPTPTIECSKSIYSSDGDLPVNVSVILGNMPPIPLALRDTYGVVTCEFSSSDAQDGDAGQIGAGISGYQQNRARVEAKAMIVGPNKVVCDLPRTSQICTNLRLGRWSVNVFSHVYGSNGFGTKDSGINFSSDTDITCFGDITALKVCTPPTLEETKQTASPFDCANTFTVSVTSGGNMNLPHLRVEVRNFCVLADRAGRDRD
jgi:hypothetical protein